MAELEKIVVTRHKSLVKWLILNKYVNETTPHVSRVEPSDLSIIENKHVFGILPNWLACHAAKLTELQLNLPIEKRNMELSIKDIDFYLVSPRTYKIRKVEND